MNRSRWLTALLREPLAHFLLAGAALYAVSAAVRPPGLVDSASREINVPASQVELLANAYERSRGSSADKSTLQALIEEYVREEIAYREASALGLDRDDPVIRRRLQQKLSFLLEDNAATLEPTDDELREFLDANRESFIAPERVSFRQIFVASEGEVEGTKRAGEILDALQSGASPDEFGDASILPRQMLDSTPAVIKQIFGATFTGDLQQVPMQQWSGPIQSEYGLHLVNVMAWREIRDPGIAGARDELRYALLQQRRRESLNARYQDLRDRYTVRVEWPDSPTTNKTKSR